MSHLLHDCPSQYHLLLGLPPRTFNWLPGYICPSPRVYSKHNNQTDSFERKVWPWLLCSKSCNSCPVYSSTIPEFLAYNLGSHNSPSSSPTAPSPASQSAPDTAASMLVFFRHPRGDLALRHFLLSGRLFPDFGMTKPDTSFKSSLTGQFLMVLLWLSYLLPSLLLLHHHSHILPIPLTLLCYLLKCTASHLWNMNHSTGRIAGSLTYCKGLEQSWHKSH